MSVKEEVDVSKLLIGLLEDGWIKTTGECKAVCETVERMRK